METISRMIADPTTGQSSFPATANLETFCSILTQGIFSEYEQRGIDIARLRVHPEERLTASAVVYSSHYRQIWMIGDCQCMVDGVAYDNAKPHEERVASIRAAYLRQLLDKSLTSVDELRRHDIGRDHIKAELIESCRQQNIAFAVIDGFPIAMEYVKTICLNPGNHDIVLASDGYPQLFPTLAECEHHLDSLLAADPLLISRFKATKGVAEGNKSFDDRSYIRFSIE